MSQQPPIPPQWQPQPPQGAPAPKPPIYTGNNAFGRLSRNAQVGVGCVTLLIVCCVFGLIVQAANGGGKSTVSADSTATTQQATNTTGPTATPKPPTATPKPKAWTTVTHLAGNTTGTKTTDTFRLQTGDHIVWHFDGSSPDLFAASIYKQGESFGNNAPYQDITNVANGDSQGDTITFQGSSADVYLWTDTDNVSWTVDIQRLQ